MVDADLGVIHISAAGRVGFGLRNHAGGVIAFEDAGRTAVLKDGIIQVEGTAGDEEGGPVAFGGCRRCTIPVGITAVCVVLERSENDLVRRTAHSLKPATYGQ